MSAVIDRESDDLEDYYLGARVLERLRKGDEEVRSIDDVERDLGLKD
jgi:predicted DNA-binding protein